MDSAIFERLKKKAIDLLSNTEKNQYTQAIVVLSTTGNEYSAIIRNALSEEKANEESLLQNLRETNDNEICFILCMWQDEHIDIPSFAFRKSLLSLNEKNSEAMLFVMTTAGVSGMKLAATLQ